MHNRNSERCETYGDGGDDDGGDGDDGDDDAAAVAADDDDGDDDDGNQYNPDRLPVTLENKERQNILLYF